MGALWLVVAMSLNLAPVASVHQPSVAGHLMTHAVKVAQRSPLPLTGPFVSCKATAQAFTLNADGTVTSSSPAPTLICPAP